MKLTSGKALTAAIAMALSLNALAGDGTDQPGEMRTSVEAEMRIMDTNKDGKISAAEHATGAKQMFRGMDRNKDDRVTASEMDAAQQTAKAAGHGQTDLKHSAEKSSAEKIKVVDSDGDGALTAKEHEAGSKKMFSKMDADKDGSLTAAEIEAGHSKMMTASDH